MTGKNMLDADELEAMELSSKPTKKSDFASRQFKNTQDFVRGFMHEQEFVEIILELQAESMLKDVRLFVLMIEFKQYQKSNNITGEQFKKSLKKVIGQEKLKATGKALTDNDSIKIDQISKKLVKVFDTNKNGKLEFQEAVAAFCILCKGSIQAKLKYLMLAYSEVVKDKRGKAGADVDLEEVELKDLAIRLKNLKKFMLCVLRLALCSSPEIMLDYPVDKLAAATAEKCMQHAGVTDRKNGVISLD